MRHIYLLLILITTGGFAQNFPENGPLYTSTEIPKVHITIDVDSLEDLYLVENWYANYHYTALFVFENEAGMDTLDNIGLRFRGNTSRDKMKKSFKVSFNTYEPGRKFHGVEKLNLNAETNDPSMIRSRIGWDLCREMGIVASRSNHVELYINGSYYGLYQNIEHVDEEFAESRFDSKQGNLYKCLYGADLDYISDNPNDYKLTPYGNRTYELKTNNESDDYSNLADFIAFLNQSDDEEFRCEFQDYFNVNAYLKIAAFDVLIGNWDGYIFNNNNYYLYENPLTGRVDYIPYDLDNTWGIDWMGPNWATRNIYNWDRDSQPRPLFTRLMDEPEYRDIFTWYVANALENHFNTIEQRGAIEALHNFISASALADPYRPLDFDFDEDDFLESLTETAASHVDYSVFGFGDLREEMALNQLENTSIAPIIMEVKSNFSDLPDLWSVQVFTEGPEAVSGSFSYTLNGVNQANISANLVNNVLSFEIPIPQGPVELEYNISINGQNGLSRSAYCDARTIRFNQADQAIFINEVMTSNQAVVADEQGEYEDWIELYNNSTSAINLRNFYLSDNNSAPLKWQLPDVTLSAGEHMLFWADSDTDQGALHTNFNLSAQGEKLYLMKSQNNILTIVDRVEIPAFPSNQSYGRETDANENWIYFLVPTPDATNAIIDGLTELNSEEIGVFPNPTKGLLFFSDRSDYQVNDVFGSVLFQGSGKEIDLGNLAAGVYLLNLNGRVVKVLKD